MILQGYIYSILYAMAVIALAMVVGKLGVPKKYTRKIVHILVGFEWVILTHFHGAGSHHFIAVCLLFTLLLFVDYKMKLLPAMSSEGDNAPGTVYYAVAMSVMAIITAFVPDMIYPFGIGVFCTSFGDGFAAVVGQLVKKHNPKIFGKKTLFGTLTNLAVSFLVALGFSHIFDLPLQVWHCALIALLSVELELVTGFGLDNIIITVSTSLLSYLFIYSPLVTGYIAAIIFTPLIIALSLRKKALTVGGIIAAVILDAVISVSLGNFGFVTLMTFFAVAVAVDKVKKRLKAKKGTADPEIEKKGDCRDSVQVLANGLAAGVAALLYIFLGERFLVFAFVAALAEALADTVASGIGSLSGRVYDPFRMKACIPGESGGMSVIGTVASLLGALLVSLVPLCFGVFSITDSLLVSLAAFLGGVLDSMLGSLVQVKYKCPCCGKILEKESHCGTATVKYRGVSFINNDVVNILGTFFAALVAAAFALL